MGLRSRRRTEAGWVVVDGPKNRGARRTVAGACTGRCEGGLTTCPATIVPPSLGRAEKGAGPRPRPPAVFGYPRLQGTPCRSGSGRRPPARGRARSLLVGATTRRRRRIATGGDGRRGKGRAEGRGR